KSTSELYLALVPQLNSKCVALLDHKRGVSQLCALERRASRGGREQVTHPVHGHDDVANSIAGAVFCAWQAMVTVDVIVAPFFAHSGARSVPGNDAPQGQAAALSAPDPRIPAHWLQQDEPWKAHVLGGMRRGSSRWDNTN